MFMRFPKPFFLVLLPGCFWLLASCLTTPAASQNSTIGAGDSGSPVMADTNASPITIFEALAKAVQENYPMLEYVGWHDEWAQEFRTRIAAAPTREAAFELMDEFVCRLNDYHTRLSWPDKPRQAAPPFRVEPALITGTIPPTFGIWGEARPPLELPAFDGVAIAVVEADKSVGLQAGDEILTVEDVTVREALTRAWRHSVGSSVAAKLRSAAGRMLSGRPGSKLMLTVRRHRHQGGEETVSATVLRSKSSAEGVISSREADGVPVIRIARWSNGPGEDLVAQFDQLLDRFRNRPGIIIDVRGNGGGKDEFADQVTGRFLKTPVIASINFRRQSPALIFERRVVTAVPRGPWRYEGRVAVLTDEGCMSACGHFVSGMIEGGALACGTPTRGACGLYRTVELPGGARLQVSRTFPLHAGGVPSPQFGIVPHLWTPRTLADLQAGEDTALRAARRWVKSIEPLPARLQPVTTYAH